MGKPCVVGAEGLTIDFKNKTIGNGERVLTEGDIISIDGSLGEVYIGELQTEHQGHQMNSTLLWIGVVSTRDWQ